MKNQVSSDSISPEHIRVILNDLKAKEETKIVFDVFGVSEETISNVIGPFNDKVLLITGKSISELIEENRLWWTQ